MHSERRRRRFGTDEDEGMLGEAIVRRLTFVRRSTARNPEAKKSEYPANFSRVDCIADGREETFFFDSVWTSRCE